jgi:hypothetical protein
MPQFLFFCLHLSPPPFFLVQARFFPLTSLSSVASPHRLQSHHSLAPSTLLSLALPLLLPKVDPLAPPPSPCAVSRHIFPLAMEKNKID